MADERLDFARPTRLQKSYLVASSYRCGSTYLCWLLWETGLLGAPSEVLNPTSELRLLMNRFKTSSPAQYVAKLLERRTSKNGVFGLKAHFHHFEAFWKEYPALLEMLAPMNYIYINRLDKIAQAVSMAKALQTNRWHSRMEEGPKPPMRYDRETITSCLADIERQEVTWRRWFDTHNVTPFEVTYDDLTANAESVVRSIVELLGVQNDEREEVELPPVKKQGDETNEAWIERFKRETRAGGESRQTDAVDEGESLASRALLAPGRSRDAHFFDRYSTLVKNLPAEAASATGFFDLIRLRRRYEAIVTRNQDKFRNARVLDVMSAHGFWSLAALDAGATHVVGVEESPALVEKASKTFEEYNVSPQSYQFINSEVFATMRDFEPQAFDLVLCQGCLEQCDIRRLFRHLDRLQPKNVILDTGIVEGSGPVVRFTFGISDIMGTPNHQLIMFLCEAFNFRWRLIDWRGMGITDWTGIHEYERDQRRTYVLDRIS